MQLFRKTAGGVYLAHNATVVGDVEIAADASVWFNAVIRGDVAKVTIGARSNVQDGAIIHCDSGVPNVIEEDVVIGHAAVVHGVRVGASTLVGMSATLLGRSNIGRECLIGAGAVVAPGSVIPDRSLVMGVPGKVVRQVGEKDLEYMRWLSQHYVALATKYVAGHFATYE